LPQATAELTGGLAVGAYGGFSDQDFEDNCRWRICAGDGGSCRSADGAGVGGRLRRLSWRRFSGGGWGGGGFHGGGWGGRGVWHGGYWRGGYWNNGWWGPAVAAGVLTGAAIASYPYWDGGYGGGCWQVRPTYDAYGNFLGQQSENVC
jgi:hypothetical protein